jgi:hypothetical protein
MHRSRPRRNRGRPSPTLGEGDYEITQYDLLDCGVDGLGTIAVEGALTKLRVVAGAPILFLLDEHDTTAQCILVATPAESLRDLGPHVLFS